MAGADSGSASRRFMMVVVVAGFATILLGMLLAYYLLRMQ